MTLPIACGSLERCLADAPRLVVLAAYGPGHPAGLRC